MNRLTCDHIAAAVVAQGLVHFGRAGEWTFRPVAMDFLPQTQIKSHCRTQRVKVLVWYESNDEIRSGFDEAPAFSFGILGNEINLWVVEEEFSEGAG